MSTRYEMQLFKKTTADLSAVKELADKLAKHSFKQSVVLERDYNKKDTLIAYVGTTHAENLISVWSRIQNKRHDADYGIRISEKLVKRLSDNSNALKILLSNFKYEDSNELRCSFSNLSDIENFFDTFFAYVSAIAETKSAETTAETTTESQTA